MVNNDLELLRNITVLYVEDELDIQKITADVLGGVCKEVVSASNGLEALELFLSRGDFDILVTDINMPKMDGITLIKKIREVDHSFPVTITTAHTEIHFLQESINLGVNGYTLKPIDLKKLIETVAKVAEPRYLRKKLERLNSELLMRVKEQTFELNSILDSQENLVAVSDGKNIHTINKRFLDFLGFSTLSELSEKVTSICDLFIKEDGYYFTESQDNICCFSQINFSKNSDIFIKMKNSFGVVFIFKLNISFYEFNGTHYILSLTDITTMKSQSDLLQYKANHDSLTGLYNRQYFNDFLQTEINRALRYEHPFTVAMFDIDYFKKINDTYGHDIGDEVLENLSNLVKKDLRDTDILARWGGEEFMILLSETPIEDGYSKVELLRELVKESILSKTIADAVTVSFGVTTFHPNDTKDSLLKRVDIALYEAKNGGRNRVVQL